MTEEFPELQQIKTDHFSAWVLPLYSLPASKIYPLINSETDAGKQMSIMIQLMRENLAPDLIDEYDNLTMQQTLTFLMEWARSSKLDEGI
jgi:hypothetical protein